jgi:hypothetical protein
LVGFEERRAAREPRGGNQKQKQARRARKRSGCAEAAAIRFVSYRQFRGPRAPLFGDTVLRRLGGTVTDRGTPYRPALSFSAARGAK